MATKKVTNVLTPNELQLLKQTITHFLQNPDYATGEETGRTFRSLKFGQPLPLEIVIRDWRTDLNEGTGGRDERNGDCFKTYIELCEAGEVNPDDLQALLGDIM
ncbi:MAG TPA: hypothetical protein VN893_16070 [Bryobacteraceae bacterium]|nr:hypothetical protein [Bryobacteraceae bacterium]